MVRQQTNRMQKLSPLASRPQKASTARYIRARQKSPLAAIHPSVRDVRTRLQSTNTNRFLKTRSQLATICEEEGEEEEPFDRGFDPYRELHAFERDEERSRRRHGGEQDELMDWDDESTLVALLQESAPGEDEEEDLAQLANRLRAPMAAQGAIMKKYLADTLVPVLTRVKEVHGLLEDKVDLAFGAGILTFDEVCKKVEAMALRDEDDLKTAYTDAQQAYTRRDALWIGHLLTDHLTWLMIVAERAKATLEALPAELEVVIAQLERRSKDLDKDSGAASKQKMLMGLLDKLMLVYLTQSG
ncbi:hypothetical protein IEO21_03186 [Rhodonia placenta]|uniref:Uncharacterized protein n=1 Tax=Rhodonia placenta TaxID=104341 RepID=A0A8H7P691_9APHY|nr:hypothetical protein IEO21_03186 [Postia placenta]